MFLFAITSDEIVPPFVYFDVRLLNYFVCYMLAEFCYAAAREYTMSRKQFGAPLAWYDVEVCVSNSVGFTDLWLLAATS